MHYIRKAKKDADHPYVMILRELLYDKHLSLKAKGLLCFLISKPDDWKIYIAQLAGELKEAKNTVAGVINELIEQGYCLRSHCQDDHGKFAGYEYLVFESIGERQAWEEEMRGRLFPVRREDAL